MSIIYIIYYICLIAARTPHYSGVTETLFEKVSDSVDMKLKYGYNTAIPATGDRAPNCIESRGPRSTPSYLRAPPCVPAVAHLCLLVLCARCSVPWPPCLVCPL